MTDEEAELRRAMFDAPEREARLRAMSDHELAYCYNLLNDSRILSPSRALEAVEEEMRRRGLWPPTLN